MSKKQTSRHIIECPGCGYPVKVNLVYEVAEKEEACIEGCDSGDCNCSLTRPLAPPDRSSAKLPPFMGVPHS